MFARRWLAFNGLLLIAGLLACIAAGMMFFGCIFVIGAMRLSAGGGIGDGFHFNDSETAIVGATVFAIAVVGPAIQQIGAAAVAFGTVQLLRGQQAEFGRCLKHGFAVMLPVTGTAAVVSLILAIPVFGLGIAGATDNTGLAVISLGLVVVPAPLLVCLFLVAVPVAAMERAGVGRALARSIRLTRGSYFRVLAMLLVLAAVYSAVIFLLGMLAHTLWDLATLVAIAALLAISTFAAVVVAVAYAELCRVKDGFGAEEIATLFD